MPGFHVDPEGDVYERARHKIALIAALLAGRKNIPVHIDWCDDVAAFAVTMLDRRDLFQLVYIPAGAALDRTVWLVGMRLDDIAAVNAVRIFAHAGQMTGLSNLQLHELAGTLLLKMNPTGAVARIANFVWPDSECLERVAADHFSGRPVGSSDELLTIMVLALSSAPTAPVCETGARDEHA